MFFNPSKEKLLKFFLVGSVLLIFVTLSFLINSKYQVEKGFKLYARKLKEEISYVWSEKFVKSFKERGASAALLATIGTTSPEIVGSGGRSARSIPVLVYHGLPNEGIGQIDHSVFVDHMKSLSDNGWDTITLEELERFLNNEILLPEKSFLLTFDDGRKDTFYPADPVLKDLGYNAVMFVINKKSIGNTSEDSTYYMSEYELRNMDNSGRWEIESHGRDSHDWYFIDASGNTGHFFSNLLWLEESGRVETPEEYRDRIVYDLTRSKSEIENAIEGNVDTIAFPFGEFGQNSVNYPASKAILEEEVSKVYKFAFYQAWRSVSETFNYPYEKKMTLKRIEPDVNWGGSYLEELLSSGLSKDLPYRTSQYGLEWVPGWGEVEKGGGISLRAVSTTGSSASLNGSAWWTDYTFSADVEWHDGKNIVIYGRRDDEKDYHGCNFETGKVSVKRASDNRSSNLVSVAYEVPLNSNLAVSFKDNAISCIVNGNIVLTEEVDTLAPNGGIGIEVWDPMIGVASATFKNISVVPD